MIIQNPAVDQWDAIYYTNPVPLSSRSLIAFALLFDRIHFPGVSIPQLQYEPEVKKALRKEWVPSIPELSSQNLAMWAIEQPSLSDFVYLPDVIWPKTVVTQYVTQAHRLIDDTYGEGVSSAVISMAATESFWVPDSGADHAMVFTWPLYQARALEYAQQSGLPLVSDDLRIVPPLPPHPQSTWTTKGLAQQLAIEAISLVLPTFRSVEPGAVAEFRAETRDLARPFRIEMAKMTADLGLAIAAGETDVELRAMCKHIAQTGVLPALEDLARQLKEPVKPWHRIALEVTEASLAAFIDPKLVVAWSILRGAKIASEYAKVYEDRQGKKKSGLAYLLKVQDHVGARTKSEWDQRDWRCSGFFDLPEPGYPLTPRAQRLTDEIWRPHGYEAVTTRRVRQYGTQSIVNWVHPASSLLSNFAPPPRRADSEVND